MTQNNLLDSTKGVLFELLHDSVYKSVDILEKDPKFYHGFVSELPLEQRIGVVEEYLRMRSNRVWRMSIQKLLSYVDGIKVSDVVDAGSGPGISAEHIIDQFNPNRLVLVDIMPEMLDVAKQRLESRREPYDGKIEYIEGPVESLHKLVKEPVDLVFMHSVMRYVTRQNQEPMLKGIRRKTLRDGGMLLFDIPFEDADSPPVELYVAQTFAALLHKLYGIPKLDELSTVTMPTSSLTNYVDNALPKAGFKRISKNPGVVYLTDQQIRAVVVDFMSDLIEAVRKPQVPPLDYQRLKDNMPNFVRTISEFLSGQRMYLRYPLSHVVYVATK